MVYGGKAIAKKTGKYERFIGDKDNTSAAKDLHEARYWLAHATVGIAARAIVVSMVSKLMNYLSSSMKAKPII